MKMKLIAASVLSVLACSQASAEIRLSAHMQESQDKIVDKYNKQLVKTKTAPSLDYKPSKEYLEYYNSLKVDRYVHIDMSAIAKDNKE